MLHPPIRYFGIVVVICLLETFGGCSRVSSSVTNPRANTPEHKTTLASEAQPPVLICPPAGTVTASPLKTGHHRVILSWKTSVRRLQPEAKVIGYCLYRSEKKGEAKHQATCKECERINLTPIPGTVCIDDVVEDGARYYYVATAMSAQGKMSSPSNETVAPIPDNKHKAKFSGPAYPLCRVPIISK